MDYRFDTIAMAVSQHYRLMKSIVTGDGYPRPLTDEEASLADHLTDVISAVAGRKLAMYCADKFQHGWLSGDLRSYKIKFAMLKLRDSLKGEVQEDLISRLDSLISYAEQMAGCVSDSKRRNKAAKEAQRIRMEEKNAQKNSRKFRQMDLFEDDGSSEEDSLYSGSAHISASTMDDCELLASVPSLVSRRSRSGIQTSNSADCNISTVDKKRSRADRKFAKMTQEILKSEYEATKDIDEDIEEDIDEDCDYKLSDNCNWED